MKIFLVLITICFVGCKFSKKSNENTSLDFQYYKDKVDRFNEYLSYLPEISLPLQINNCKYNFPRVNDSLTDRLKNSVYTPKWEKPIAKIHIKNLILIIFSNECCQGDMIDIASFDRSGTMIGLENINYTEMGGIMQENCNTSIDNNLKIKMRYTSKSFSMDSGKLIRIDTSYINFTINDNGIINKMIEKDVRIPISE